MNLHNFKSIKSLLGIISNDPIYIKGLTQEKIHHFWYNDLPEVFQKHTRRLYLKNGKLYIDLDSSIIRHELLMSKQMLIDRINNMLDEDAVKDIIIR